MQHCMLISGTRPEIIKLAPVYLALKESASVIWTHSGQHTSIADSAFKEFGIQPDVLLERPASASLGGLLAGLIASLSEVIHHYTPQVVLVHGDTSSTLGGCLAAFYAQVPLIGHVEAGLRSGNLANPFPEEANRKLVGQLVTRHYAPLESARSNLLREGIADNQIIVTGNTVVDAQRLLVGEGSAKEGSREVLVTCHRRENWPHMQTICAAIKRLAADKPDLTFNFIMHPNAELQLSIQGYLSQVTNVHLLQPLSYRDLQLAIKNARCVITDSGGIQEEAPSFGVRTVVVRRYTERTESIDAQMSGLAAPDDEDAIYRLACDYIEQAPAAPGMLYGDGYAANRIVADLETTLSEM
ncbi:non-hydrolyzing UDP-N-acetylglucosamine 2-epimerase [Aliidiomarina sp. Khilg15.8]